MEIFPCEDVSYTPSDASLNTEVVSSNHFESAASMKERLIDAGFEFVERSIVKFGKQIGRGGQGSVYEASVSWPYLDGAAKMAVKKFNSKIGVSQGQYPSGLLKAEKFHVVRPWAFFFDDDSSLCMILPLYSGDLRSVIDSEMAKKSGPPFEEVMTFIIILQLARGMDRLHTSGVCHRDLKAANILVTTTSIDDALVAEAGFKFVHECHIADFESSWDVKGTAFWRAPEVLMSIRTGIPLTDQQWQAADVYSFGMVCYEIVTGEIPFKDKRYMDYDIVINGGRPELPDYVPELLRKIIMDCWDPNPECRPDFGRVFGVLMHEAQEDPRLEVFIAALEKLWDLSLSESENVLAELMELKDIMRRHYEVNDDAIVGHRNYASWGVKYVDDAENFRESLRKGDDVHGLMTFVDYIECQKLSALTRQSLLGLLSSLEVTDDTHQHYKDMKDHGILFVEERQKVSYLAINIHEELHKGIQMIGLDIDNDLTLEEKFKVVDGLVRDVRGALHVQFTLELLDEIIAKLDPSECKDEVAIFERHMKFIVRRTTFEKKYVFDFIMLYFICTSPYWNYILFQVFGVVLSNSHELFLGLLYPLMVSNLLNWLVSRFSKYRYYFVVLFVIFYMYIYYSLIRSYGFKRLFGWLGIWTSFDYGLSFSYAMILSLHEYLYVTIIRIGVSFFTHRIKRKEE